MMNERNNNENWEQKAQSSRFWNVILKESLFHCRHLTVIEIEKDEKSSCPNCGYMVHSSRQAIICFWFVINILLNFYMTRFWSSNVDGK